MSEHLVERYLTVFDARVRARHDRQELVDEVADHLYTTAERLRAQGVDSMAAQRRALERFGEPRLVASVLSAVPPRASVSMTILARFVGVVGVGAAFAWIAATVAWFYSESALSSGVWTQQRYFVVVRLVIVACAATTLVLTGLNVRAVGGVDRTTRVIAAVGVGATITSSATWVVGVWMPLLVVAIVWTLIRVRHIGSRATTTAMLVVLPAVAVVAIGATIADVRLHYWTTEEEWTFFLALAAWSAVLTAGFVDVAARALRYRPRRRCAG